MTDELISLNTAAAHGIERVRRPNWANPFDHFQMTIIDGAPGPWVKMWAPFNQECNGRDPVECSTLPGGPLAVDPAADQFVPYEGPQPDSEAYRAEAARFAGSMA